MRSAIRRWCSWGPLDASFENDPPFWLQDFWTDIEGGRHCGWLSLIDLGNAIKPVDPSYIWGLNFCIRKETFEHCGGFHPDVFRSCFSDIRVTGKRA